MTHHPVSQAREVLGPLIAAIGQSEAARRSGIAQANISAWLAGRRGLSLDSLDALAGAVGVRLRLVVPARPSPKRHNG